MCVIVNKIGESKFKSDKLDKTLMLYEILSIKKCREICKATVKTIASS